MSELFGIFMAFAKELFSIAKTNSEVDESSRAKLSKILVGAFCSAVAVTLILLTVKSYALTIQFKEYREKYKITAEQCLEKNHTEVPLSVGTGIIIPDTWSTPITSISGGPCKDTWCQYDRTIERAGHGK